MPAPPELIGVLSQFNPWWRHDPIADLPNWKRSALQELRFWLKNPPKHRAILLSGCRQAGKTTLLLQSIQELLLDGIAPANILYVNFDHPVLLLSGIDAVVEAWRQREPRVDGPEFVFLDEIQFINHWDIWVHKQVDSVRHRRIVMACSAMPLPTADRNESASIWHTIGLSTLSFYEYLQVQRAGVPPLPKLGDLARLFDWTPQEFLRVQEFGKAYSGHFHEYLVRGGFPQTANVESISQVQRVLREEIADKLLKRDMTTLFGVRRIEDLQHTFLYLCLRPGLLDMLSLCANLKVKRPTAQHFLTLLEAIHLIHRLPPHGYGKQVQRARYKIYLTDAAFAGAMMMRGKSLLDDPAALDMAAETAVFKHLHLRYGAQARFSYWRDGNDRPIDLVEQTGGPLVPFVTKYRQSQPGSKELKGLLDLCAKKQINRGYAVTKSVSDFGEVPTTKEHRTKLMRIPAPLLCYWLGE